MSTATAANDVAAENKTAAESAAAAFAAANAISPSAAGGAGPGRGLGGRGPDAGGRGAGRKGKPAILAPKTHAQSVGWRLRVYWPPIGKEFKGVVQDYNSRTGHHTVLWDNAPGDQTGVTEVNLNEGQVEWLSPPASATTGMGSNKRHKAELSKEPARLETVEEVEARLGKGTIKGICFHVLKKAGPHGLLLSEIVELTQEMGLKDWSSVRQPSNTVNACCSGDPAFVKVAPGRVGLAALGANQNPDLAAEEERAQGEKVLYCDDCRNGPFNAKGMRMHISRWCQYAAHNNDRKKGTTGARGDKGGDQTVAAMMQSLEEKKQKGPSQPKTLLCNVCGAGPFNEKGVAMHSARWCKARGEGTAAGVAAGVAIGVDTMASGAATPSKTKAKAGKKRKGPGTGAVEDGAAGMGGSQSVPNMWGGIERAGMLGARGGAGGMGMLPNGPFMGSSMGRQMGMGMGMGALHGMGMGARKPGMHGAGEAHMSQIAAQEQPELRLDVEVFKEDGSFVARAPLCVPYDVTLGQLKEAIATNTKGALPPFRQQLRYMGQVLSAPDEVMLVGIVGVTECITLTLTIIHSENSSG